MLVFFAISAILNICLGYVLGVYIGVLPGLNRSAHPGSVGMPMSALGDPQPHTPADYRRPPVKMAIGAPAAEPATPPPTTAPGVENLLAQASAGIDAANEDAVTNQGNILSESELDSITEATTLGPVNKVEPDTSKTAGTSAGEQVASPSESTSPILSDRSPPQAGVEHVDLEEYLTGLMSHQTQISNIDLQLREAEDPAALERCAQEIATAADDIAGQATTVSRHLMSDLHDHPVVAEEKQQLRDSVKRQSDHVENCRQQILAMNLEGDFVTCQEILLGVSADLSQAAGQLRDELASILARAADQAGNRETDVSSASPESMGEQPGPEKDELTGLATRE